MLACERLSPRVSGAAGLIRPTARRSPPGRTRGLYLTAFELIIGSACRVRRRRARPRALAGSDSKRMSNPRRRNLRSFQMDFGVSSRVLSQRRHRRESLNLESATVLVTDSKFGESPPFSDKRPPGGQNGPFLTPIGATEVASTARVPSTDPAPKDSEHVAANGPYGSGIRPASAQVLRPSH